MLMHKASWYVGGNLIFSNIAESSCQFSHAPRQAALFSCTWLGAERDLTSFSNLMSLTRRNIQWQVDCTTGHLPAAVHCKQSLYAISLCHRLCQCHSSSSVQISARLVGTVDNFFFFWINELIRRTLLIYGKLGIGEQKLFDYYNIWWLLYILRGSSYIIITAQWLENQ